MSDYDAYLAGDRTDHVALYLAESYVSDAETLADRADAERVADIRGAQPDTPGVVLVVDGESGRSVFETLTGMQAMEFGSTAMQTPGDVDAALVDGRCPNAVDGPGEDHTLQFVFSFAEAQNEEVGGLYADGDVIHAYAYCSCGTAYSDKWLAGAHDQ
ncbi:MULTISPECIES: DUF5807 family protein [Halobacterium]|uniref:DUF5807 family protein n=1 Tax=Halobacterium TaxID=2239 RepID=UPI00196260D2|nr:MULTISPECIES: DUF5807 family protein [Halobacterium]MCF2164527.1 hypothetical protein [Halobacterium salinarum]MCF2167026.1 hypothetical protein [Halobacterium salinarum]MCF2239647.1 hypothetical protein [Halobacterium salinarum]MDL0135775.1 DUF5807 family protein [Halobacterium salinarum]QRY22637.1 hypothetical protein JT689_11620 [Halobacterium sp. GSL-19]